MLATDIARLMAQIPKEEQMALEGTRLAGRAKSEQLPADEEDELNFDED
jgi:hypothetical protein